VVAPAVLFVPRVGLVGAGLVAGPAADADAVLVGQGGRAGPVRADGVAEYLVAVGPHPTDGAAVVPVRRHQVILHRVIGSAAVDEHAVAGIRLGDRAAGVGADLVAGNLVERRAGVLELDAVCHVVRDHVADDL